MFLSRCIHPCRASPLTLLRYLGIVFLAILCKASSYTAATGDVRLNLQTVDWFLFGVISQQFYLYWISGEFVGWSKISTILTW